GARRARCVVETLRCLHVSPPYREDRSAHHGVLARSLRARRRASPTCETDLGRFGAIALGSTSVAPFRLLTYAYRLLRSVAATHKVVKDSLHGETRTDCYTTRGWAAGDAQQPMV